MRVDVCDVVVDVDVVAFLDVVVAVMVWWFSCAVVMISAVDVMCSMSCTQCESLVVHRVIFVVFQPLTSVEVKTRAISLII